MAASTIEEAVHTYALADSNITAVIGNRFFFAEAEENASLPYVYYFAVSDPHEPFAFGETASGQVRIQFTGVSADRYAALSLGNLIVDRFHLFGGTTMDGITVESIKCTGPIVLRPADQDVFQVIVDAVIIYEEP